MSNIKFIAKHTTVPGAIPTTASLDVGEIAINSADGILFTRLSNNSIQSIGQTGSFTGSFSGSVVVGSQFKFEHVSGGIYFDPTTAAGAATLLINTPQTGSRAYIRFDVTGSPLGYIGATSLVNALTLGSRVGDVVLRSNNSDSWIRITTNGNMSGTLLISESMAKVLGGIYPRSVTDAPVGMIGQRKLWTGVGGETDLAIAAEAGSNIVFFPNGITSGPLVRIHTGSGLSVGDIFYNGGSALEVGTSGNARAAVHAASGYAAHLMLSQNAVTEYSIINSGSGANNGLYIAQDNVTRLKLQNGGNLYVANRIGIGEMSPQKGLHVTFPVVSTEVASIIVEGYPNAYGAGYEMASRTSAGGPLVSTGKITADGDSSWNASVETQMSSLRFFNAFSGSLYKRAYLNYLGDFVVTTGSVRSARGGYFSGYGGNASDGHYVEITTQGGNAFVVSYDRTAVAYKPLYIDASVIAFRPGSSGIESGRFRADGALVLDRAEWSSSAGAVSPLDVNGPYIRIGDYQNNRAFDGNSLGIKFYDGGNAHASMVYSSTSQSFFFGSSTGSSALLPFDAAGPAFRIDLLTNNAEVTNDLRVRHIKSNIHTGLNIIASGTVGGLFLWTQEVPRWYVDVNGNFIPYDHAVYDIGRPTSVARNLHMSGFITASNLKLTSDITSSGVNSTSYISGSDLAISGQTSLASLRVTGPSTASTLLVTGQHTGSTIDLSSTLTVRGGNGVVFNYPNNATLGTFLNLLETTQFATASAGTWFGIRYSPSSIFTDSTSNGALFPINIGGQWTAQTGSTGNTWYGINITPTLNAAPTGNWKEAAKIRIQGGSMARVSSSIGLLIENQSSGVTQTFNMYISGSNTSRIEGTLQVGTLAATGSTFSGVSNFVGDVTASSVRVTGPMVVASVKTTSDVTVGGFLSGSIISGSSLRIANDIVGANLTATGSVRAERLVWSTGSVQFTVTNGSSAVIGTGATVAVSGSGLGGYIQITTGTGITQGGPMVSLTWLNDYSTSPPCIVHSAGNIKAAVLSAKTYFSTAVSSPSDFIVTGTLGNEKLADSTTYKWFYMIVGQGV